MDKPQNDAERAKKTTLIAWLNLAAMTTLAVFFFIAMEWLFFVTKPSFMDYIPFTSKLGILLLPGLLLAVFCLPLLAVLFAISQLPRLNRLSRWWLAAGALLPAAFMAFTALMLIDNFTYTVFKFGIVHSQGAGRAVYAAIFLALFAGCAVWVTRRLFQKGSPKRLFESIKPTVYASAALLILAVLFSASLFFSAKSVDSVLETGMPARQPNILLIGTDGLDADKTSIYHPQPDTTPFLRGFAQQTLLAENNFPNATFTSGSLVSMFTSKLPTQTRMLYPPDILQGSDAFQHLPGILKKAGYYNAEISVDYYADPSVLNIQDGFVMINGRSSTIGRLYTLSRSYLPESAAYFLSTIAKRLTDRLFHIFYYRAMPNPYAEVRQKLSNMSDADRLGQVISLYNDISQPLFIHAHLMATHTNEQAIYDQAIADYDLLMQNLINELNAMGELEQTLVVVYTDHSYGNHSNVRIPLMFRFPNGEHQGRITGNTQNMDIAPTILDYIGIQPPAWMHGQSLLRGEPDPTRPIFSAAPSSRADEENLLQIDQSKIRPPFYQFGGVQILVCQQWTALDTFSLTWSSGQVEGHTTPCAPENLPDEAQARQMLLDQLEKDGFDVSEARK